MIVPSYLLISVEENDVISFWLCFAKAPKNNIVKLSVYLQK